LNQKYVGSFDSLIGKMTWGVMGNTSLSQLDFTGLTAKPQAALPRLRVAGDNPHEVLPMLRVVEDNPQVVKPTLRVEETSSCLADANYGDEPLLRGVEAILPTHPQTYPQVGRPKLRVEENNMCMADAKHGDEPLLRGVETILPAYPHVGASKVCVANTSPFLTDYISAVEPTKRIAEFLPAHVTTKVPRPQ
jgi:hypothetical protein